MYANLKYFVVLLNSGKLCNLKADLHDTTFAYHHHMAFVVRAACES